MILGISEEYVIDHQEGDEYWPEELAEDAVIIARNDTDPTVITDGVDVISIVEEGDVYKVNYWGYMVGEMQIEGEGVQELGALLRYDGDVPGWLLDEETIDANDLPWWVPEDIEIRPTVECQRCDETVYAGDIVTPMEYEHGGYRFCRTCWEEIESDFHESMAEHTRDY